MEDGSFILRFQENSEEKHQAILSELNKIAEEGAGTAEELRFDSIGPSIGKELKSKSFNAIIIVLIIIIAYIAFAFRKISRPVASWKYGMAAIVALAHDILITLGVFAVLGEYWGVEINTPFVAALLTILGYSINDTIVVFDRIRENLPRSEEDFEGTVNISVNQTLARSVNTSLTVLFVLFAILFWGGSTIRDFVLALTIGVFVGTYSSIFVASPVLVVWEKMKK
jgi:preprotein translocase subunit SecF